MPRPRHRPNRLPAPPPPLRHRVHSPSNAPRESSLDRVRRISREHKSTERPFDPERRGSWKGSSRDLVVNPRRRLSHRDDVEETFLFIDEEVGGSSPRAWLVVNPLDYPRGKHASYDSLFAYCLGAYGSSCFLVWGKSFEDTVEELAGFCEQFAKGHLTTEEDVGKLMAEVREDEPGIDDEEAYEKATADLTYTESGYFVSYEMTADELHSGPLYQATVEACHEEYVAEYGEDG